jgi:hypothetical protein
MLVGGIWLGVVDGWGSIAYCMGRTSDDAYDIYTIDEDVVMTHTGHTDVYSQS